MPLATFDLQVSVTAEELTPEAFARFGGVISVEHQLEKAKLSSANYGTAVKLHKVAPIVNNFAKCGSGVNASPNLNVFRCSPPHHLLSETREGRAYSAKVLERHPFSSQTFVPMGQSGDASYLVIVAESEDTPEKLPDKSSVRAFVCKGTQSVTYGPGVWHAPMVVIDEVPYIDFAVFIHENGVEDEDCQECYFEPGYTVEFR